MWTAVIAGAAAGLASVPHCTAMCGPLAAYACSGRPGASGQSRYQLGRFISYSALGAVAGTALLVTVDPQLGTLGPVGFYLAHQIGPQALLAGETGSLDGVWRLAIVALALLASTVRHGRRGLQSGS